MHPSSLSRQLYQPGDRQLAATIAVCHKALHLLQTPTERAALVQRLHYELRQAVRNRAWAGARELYALLRTVTPRPGVAYRVLGMVAALGK